MKLRLIPRGKGVGGDVDAWNERGMLKLSSSHEIFSGSKIMSQEIISHITAGVTLQSCIPSHDGI